MLHSTSTASIPSLAPFFRRGDLLLDIIHSLTRCEKEKGVVVPAIAN